jgi:glycosyltransferase involved in cell wall biosynthesis
VRWAIITGEYPPDPGGVSDYTAAVAEGLARLGDEVHVWAPLQGGRAAPTGPVTVHRLRHQFHPAGLAELSRGLARLRRPFRILVQYVPQAFGMRGMNLGFGAWLYAHRAWDVSVMFHEVYVMFRRGGGWSFNLLAATTHGMAALALRAARRVFMSTSSWEPHLRRLGRLPRRTSALFIPSNTPENCPAGAVAAARARWGVPPDAVVLGSFGTYANHRQPWLGDTLGELLGRRPDRFAVLVGRGSEGFAAQLAAQRPSVGPRVLGLGTLPGPDVAASLAAADLLLQPYQDGATTRRTSLMAGLALGKAIVTTDGCNTEPCWRVGGAVLLAPAGSEGLVQVSEAVLADPALRAATGERAARLYQSQFSLTHTLTVLRQL